MDSELLIVGVEERGQPAAIRIEAGSQCPFRTADSPITQGIGAR